MTDGGKPEFAQLALNGRNYLTWADNCQFHLTAMELSEAITKGAKDASKLTEAQLAKASIFLRRHIHSDLKMEYLNMKDPLALWNELQERFGGKEGRHAAAGPE